jgi:hypothetical protein
MATSTGRSELVRDHDILDELPIFLDQPGYRRARAVYSKAALRAKLNSPIKEYLFKDSRWRESKRQTEVRIEAAFALYNIPDDWEQSLQWEWLARSLLGNCFKGCKTLSQGRGGPRKERLKLLAQYKNALAKTYEQYRAEHPEFSELTAATCFLKKHPKESLEVGIRKPKSLAQAMRRIIPPAKKRH